MTPTLFGEPRCYRDNNDSSSKPPARSASPDTLPYTSQSLPGHDFYFLRGRETAGVPSLGSLSQAGHSAALPAFDVERVRRDFPAFAPEDERQTADLPR